MIVLVVMLALVLGVVAYVALRNRIIFMVGLRNIPRRRAQTILIVLGLMLSTLIISAAFTTGDTVSRSMTSEAYGTLGHVDETIQIGENLDKYSATLVQREPLPQSMASDLQQKLKSDSQVDGVMAVIFQPVAVLDMRSMQTEPLAVISGVDTTQLSAFPDVVDSDGKPVDLANLPADQIFINQSLADELQALPGDSLEVYSQNKLFSFKVAGIVQDRLLTGATPFRKLGMVTRIEVLQQDFGREGQADFIAISNQGGVRSGIGLSDSVTATLTTILGDKTRNVDPIKAREVKDAADLGSVMVTIFVMLGMFSIMAGVLLIFMIFVMLAAERKSEMGISRAVGMKRGHLVQMFLAEGMGYNLAAALVGVTLGVLVSLGMTQIMAVIFSEFKLAISFHVTWRTIVISYAAGVVLTFITVTISSWRVSSLNIVRAIRDLPEPRVAKGSRKALYLGVVGIVIGLMVTRNGLHAHKMFPFAFGVTLVILGLAPVLRFKGVRERPVYTFAGLAMLVFWILGAGGYLEGATGNMTSGMEMFFLSGMVMVLAATFIIVHNSDILLKLIERMGGRMSRVLPAVKTAVAYPMASKLRTGMTMAMISLVVFALVVQSTMSANFDRVFLSDGARGGWDLTVTENAANPLGDLQTALAGKPGVDTSKFQAIGEVQPIVSREISLRQNPMDEFASYPVRAVDRGFLTQNQIKLQARAIGYSTDQSVWQSMANDPSLAVIDSSSLNDNAHMGGTSDYALEGIKAGDHAFAPIPIEVQDDVSGRTSQVTLVGIISGESSGIFSGLFVSQSVAREITGLARPDFTIYVVRLAPGQNAKATAAAIESALLTKGVQGNSIKDELEKQQRLTNGFFWLLEGFMGLGLLVGTAAVGVIAFRTVVERRKQIGMLRAIGYQRNTVGLSFILESSFVALLGILSGVVLAVILAYMVMNSPSFSVVDIQSFVVPWWHILLIVGFSYGSTLLMSIIPSRQASSLPIAEALRYE